MNVICTKSHKLIRKVLEFVIGERMVFAIVRFTAEKDAPGIISTNWILDVNENSCWYPNVMTEDSKNKLLRARASPEKEWLKCPIRVLRKFSSYESARNHLRAAEDTSNLESESENMKSRQRKRKRNHFYHSDESSSENEDPAKKFSKSKRIELYPQPPALTLNSISKNNSPAASTSPNSTSLLADMRPSPIPPPAASSSSSLIQELNRKVDRLWSSHQSMQQVMEELLETNKRIELKVDAVITQNSLQAATSPNDEDNAALDLLTSLPLGADEFSRFDEAMAQNSDLRKRLINICMTTVGGRDPKSLVTGLMRRVMRDEAAEKYSLTGKSTKNASAKEAFEKTSSYKLILEICFRSFKHVKLNVLREAMSDWLMQAKFRKSRRENRAADMNKNM